MKGFKPTGYGPSPGFKYPSSFGFTGSTGRVTQVSAHTRQKPAIPPQHFADGGFVRQDNPRMKEDMIGDQGSPLVRRARSYTQADQESGGKGPLRPGYKKGGKAKGALAMAFGKKKMRKADGGKVARGSNAKGFWESVSDIPGALKELIRSSGEKAAENSSGMVKDAGEKITGRQKQIDKTVDEMSKAKGGKVKRMGYAMGGVGMAGPQRAMPMRPAMMRTPVMPARAAMRSKGGKMKRMGYADGGSAKKKCM